MQSKIEAMLAQLWKDGHEAPSLLQRSLATRDGLAFSLLWSTGLEGINAREACCSDFWRAPTSGQCSQPALPGIIPHFTFETGSRVDIVPQRLKTSMRANSAGVQLTVQSNQLLDPLRLREWHILSSYAAGSPVSNFLVRLWISRALAS